MKNNNGLISGLVLLSLGLICGLLLALVNELTAERIEAEELRLKFVAIEEFYDIANYDLEEVVLENGTIYVLKSQSDSEIEHLVYSFRAKGYGDDVEMLVAVNKDLSVEGYTVTYQNESPGIGTKIVGNDFNYNQADDVSTFDSIGGATVSSNAVKAIFTAIAQRAQSDFNGGLYGDGPIDQPDEQEVTVDDFYDSDLFDVEEVEIEEGTLYILRQENEIEHLVYVISAPGYHDQIEIYVAVNRDLSVEDYIISYSNENEGYETEIVDHDFNYSVANDLSTFDSISGATVSSDAVRHIFSIIADRVEDDFDSDVDQVALRLRFTVVEEFYNVDDFELQEVILESGKIFVLRNQSTSEIEHLVYSLSAEGHSDDVVMLVAVNSDLSVEGYKVTYENETPGLGDQIIDHDFNFNEADDVSTFDSIADATDSSNAVRAIFTEIAGRVVDDFGGGLDD